MAITFTPAHRALAVGGLAAAALIAAFALGGSQGSAAPSPSAGPAPAGARLAVLASATGSARITVTGTGNVTGTPNQLVLAMGVQVNGSSVGSALARANDAVNRVTTALRQAASPPPTSRPRGFRSGRATRPTRRRPAATT